MIRASAVDMCDLSLGMTDRLRDLSDASREVGVLDIHEEPLVEASHTLQYLHACKHKATRQVGDLYWLAIVQPVHLILPIDLVSDSLTEREATQEYIPRSG